MAGLVYSHREIVTWARSIAGLQADVGGRWQAPSGAFSDRQVAERATAEFACRWQSLAVRSPDLLPTVTDALAWPAATERIALVGQPINEAHPRPTRRLAFVHAFYDQTGGVDGQAEITIVSEEQARHGLYGPGRHGYGVCAVLRGPNVEMHPKRVGAFTLGVDYVPWPAEVDPTSDAAYTSLPDGILGRAVEQLALDLATMAKDRVAGLAAMAARHEEMSRAFDRERVSRGPQFTNYLWTM